MTTRTFFVLAAFIVTTGALHGQDSTRFSQVGVVPQLNNHRFIGNQGLNSPFTNSNFQLFFGYGNSAPLGSGEFMIGDTTLELSLGTLVFVSAGTELNIQLKEWLSYNFRFGYSAKVGSETHVTLTNGIEQYSFFSNAWGIRLLERKSHYLSTSIGVSNTRTVAIDLENYFMDINNGVTSPELSSNYYALFGTFGIDYAWGVTEMLGLVVNTGISYGDLYLTGETGSIGYFGAGLDFNLYPKTKVPLGLSIAYTYRGSKDIEMPSDGTRYSARLAYTRSNSFILSMDFTANNTPYSRGFQNNDVTYETTVLTSFLRFVMYL